MKSLFRVLIGLVLVSLALSACNLPTRQTPTPAVNVPATQMAQTVEALLAEQARLTQQAQVPPTQPPAPTLAQPTLPPPPTAVPPTAVPPTPVPPTATVIPCDRAGFVSDVTVPDGTMFAPGASFVKTWRLKNTGSCSWTTSYKLVFDSGNAMEGPASAALPRNVNPGETIDLSVTLKAPATNNTYQGFWKLENATGQRFGVGDAGNSFWVKIVVGVTSAPFAVVSVPMSVNPANYAGVCPVTITFTGQITTNGAGTVTYHWERSDGSSTAVETLNFTAAGSQTVTRTWSLGSSGTNYSGWQRLYIDSPNHQYFDKAEFTITCNP